MEFKRASPFRVLMVSYELPPFGGGTGVACSHLLDEFASRGNLIADLITSGPVGGVEREARGDGIVVHRLPIPKRDLQYWRASELLLWTWRALRYAGELARVRDYELCHCWSAWPSGIVGYRLRRRMPYVVALRGSDVPGYNPRLRLLDPLVMRHISRRVWRHAARVVAVSRNLRDLALRTQPDASIDVIPNGVDIGEFTPAMPRRGGLLFVGRLIERKGVHFLIEAFRLLALDQEDLTLTVVGDGPERPRLEAMVRQHGLQARVLFRGRLDRSTLAEVYRGAGILVLPAVTEAMPNVVLEAMAAGLAIVTTRTGARELLRDNGQVVDSPEPEALRDSVLRYLRDPALLARHQQQSRRLAESMSWSKVAEYYLAVYEDVLSTPQGLTSAPGREFALPSD